MHTCLHPNDKLFVVADTLLRETGLHRIVDPLLFQCILNCQDPTDVCLLPCSSASLCPRSTAWDGDGCGRHVLNTAKLTQRDRTPHISPGVVKLGRVVAVLSLACGKCSDLTPQARGDWPGPKPCPREQKIVCLIVH